MTDGALTKQNNKMNKKEFIGAGVFSACTLTIGLYLGNKLCENKYGRIFKDLRDRIEYLENGIKKS